MNSKSSLIFWELMLLFASVLVFRGLWLLLDRIEWMSRPAGLWTSFAAGLILAAVALRAVNRTSGE